MNKSLVLSLAVATSLAPWLRGEMIWVEGEAAEVGAASPESS